MTYRPYAVAAYQPVIFNRVTNKRWYDRFDPIYVCIPLARVLGGYVPSQVQANDLHLTVGNRSRYARRDTGKLINGRVPLHRRFGGTYVEFTPQWLR